MKFGAKNITNNNFKYDTNDFKMTQFDNKASVSSINVKVMLYTVHIQQSLSSHVLCERAFIQSKSPAAHKTFSILFGYEYQIEKKNDLNLSNVFFLNIFFLLLFKFLNL